MPETDAGPGAIASPLSLLLDAASSGADAVEVLLLSFTLDLGFFEQAALSAAQALGARVTVVGDAGIVRHDPRAVRRAGRGYLAGLASLAGSFHPKLLIVAGLETATVAIGSGNLTLAGWQDNHELWTVLRAGPDGCPETIHQLADWFTRLPDVVRFSHHVPGVFFRTAELLRGLGPVAPGPRLVSPVFGPVIDQLPEGPVDELAVCCPFHDPRAVALGRLVERLQPGRLTVAIQPGLTVCDGPAISALIADHHDGEVVEVDTDRYRHGKLIEVRAGERRWVLTGSANCSAAALLKRPGEGGNIELGLLSDLQTSLMPEGAPLGQAALQAHTYKPRRVERPSIVVLGATRTEAGIEVVLSRPLRWPGHVELSAPEAQPDIWERIGEAAAGVVAVPVTWPAEGGSRLRVIAHSPDGPLPSNTVYVIDPIRALRRHGRSDGVRRPTEAFDLFADTGLAERFVADLEALRSAQLTPPRVQSVATATRSHSSTATHVVDGNWEDYLDACAGRIGNSLLRFALGLPALPSEPGNRTDTVRAAWDEGVLDDSEIGLDSDDADDVAQQADAPVVARIPSLENQSATVRRRYRRWAERLAEVAGGIGAAERLLALRLVLWIASAGAWQDSEENGWLATVGKATEALGHAPEPPREVEPATASLAAVALSILRSRAPRTQNVEANRILNRAAKAVVHLLPAAEAVYVAEYTKLLDDAFGAAAHPEVVLEVASEIVQADPLADAVRALEEHDIWDAHIHGRVLHTTKRFANPVLPALQAVGLAEAAEPVGAWAGDADNWALVIWRKPDLVVFTHGKGDRWIRYRLTGIYTPRMCAYGDRGIDRRFLQEESFGGNAYSDTVGDLLAAVDLPAPSPPPECR